MAGSGKHGCRHTVSVQIFKVHNFCGLPFSNILQKQFLQIQKSSLIRLFYCWPQLKFCELNFCRLQSNGSILCTMAHAVYPWLIDVHQASVWLNGMHQASRNGSMLRTWHQFIAQCYALGINVAVHHAST